MAIELATAYVSIVPSTKGVRKAIAEEFGGVGDDADDAGDQAGERFGGSFASKAKIALAAAGLAIGASLVKGTLDAINQEATNDQLAARLGLDPVDAGRVGEIAGNLYAAAWGDSIGQVSTALGEVYASFDGANLGDAQLETLTAQALDLAKVFETDVNSVIRASSALLDTGLVGSATDAFDLIATGFQESGSRGEDLLDTFTEYSNQFADFGVDALSFTELLVAGLEGGARSTDGVADAVKETFLRVTEGSSAALGALSELGVPLDDVLQKINDGQGAAAFADIAREITGLEDKTVAARLAQDLLGGAYEQVGLKGLAAMADFEGAVGDVTGSAQELSDVLNDNLAVRFEALKRTGFQGLAAIGEQVIPVLETIVSGVEQVVTAFGEDGLAGVTDLLREKLEPVFGFISDNASLFALVGGAILSVLVPAFVAWAISAGAAAIATIAAAAPVIAIGLAIGALAAAVVYAYQNWDFFRTAVDAVAGFIKNTLVPAIVSVVGWIGAGLVPAIVSVVGWIVDNLVPAIVSVAGFFIDLGIAAYQLHLDIVDVFEAIVGFVRELPGRLLSAAAGLWDFITEPFRDAMNAIRDLWNSTIGGFSFTVPDWIPGVGGNGFTIPTLHDGGVVPGRPGTEHLYLLEAGENVTSRADMQTMMNVESSGGDRSAPLVGTLITHERPLLEELMELRALHPAAS